MIDQPRRNDLINSQRIRGMNEQERQYLLTRRYARNDSLEEEPCSLTALLAAVAGFLLGVIGGIVAMIGVM